MKRRVTVPCRTHRRVSRSAITRILTGLSVAVAVAGVTGSSSWVHAQDLNTVPGLQERLDHERSVVEQLLNEGECPRACLALEAMRQAAGSASWTQEVRARMHDVTSRRPRAAWAAVVPNVRKLRKSATSARVRPLHAPMWHARLMLPPPRARQPPKPPPPSSRPRRRPRVGAPPAA